MADDLHRRQPRSITRAKHLLTSAAAASVDHDLERAILENARIRCTPDFKEGLAAFLEKRKPIGRTDKLRALATTQCDSSDPSGLQPG